MKTKTIILALCILALCSCSYTADMENLRTYYQEKYPEETEEINEEQTIFEEVKEAAFIAEDVGIIAFPYESEIDTEAEETVIEPFVLENEELVPESEENQAEAVFDATDEKVEKKTVLESIEDAVKGEGEPKQAIVNGNVLPMWFVYAFVLLCMAILYTMCYIAKQRSWSRIRNRD